jgi:hypothetical protein
MFARRKPPAVRSSCRQPEIGESAALMIASSEHTETIFRVSGSVTEGVRLRNSNRLDCRERDDLRSLVPVVADITTPSGTGLRANDPGVDYHQFEGRSNRRAAAVWRAVGLRA